MWQPTHVLSQALNPNRINFLTKLKQIFSLSARTAKPPAVPDNKCASLHQLQTFITILLIFSSHIQQKAFSDEATPKRRNNLLLHCGYFDQYKKDKLF